jgi:hypothetical protein
MVLMEETQAENEREETLSDDPYNSRTPVAHLRQDHSTTNIVIKGQR